MPACAGVRTWMVEEDRACGSSSGVVVSRLPSSSASGSPSGSTSFDRTLTVTMRSGRVSTVSGTATGFWLSVGAAEMATRTRAEARPPWRSSTV